MKRILTWSLALSCALTLLAGCAGQGSGTEKPTSAPENTPAATPTATPTAAPGTEEDGWYELDGEAGILTVRIPDETPQFEWRFVISDEEVLELLTQESTEGTYVASFRALTDGKSQITFHYVKDDALNEIRLLEVSCKDGKVAEVTFGNVMDLPEMGEDDPETQR